MPREALICLAAAFAETWRLAARCSIYAMRAAKEFVLEERLYWLLIRIYRSPAVLFEFTRTKRGDAMPERPRLIGGRAGGVGVGGLRQRRAGVAVAASSRGDVF